MEREALTLTKHTASEREGVTRMLASKRKDMTQDRQEAQPERMMRWFEYQHLPAHLQAVSKPFGDLAVTICDTIKPGPERTVALRKLLEAKDAGVRAYLEQFPAGKTPNNEKASAPSTGRTPSGEKPATEADLKA